MPPATPRARRWNSAAFSPRRVGAASSQGRRCGQAHELRASAVVGPALRRIGSLADTAAHCWPGRSAGTTDQADPVTSISSQATRRRPTATRSGGFAGITRRRCCRTSCTNDVEGPDHEDREQRRRRRARRRTTTTCSSTPSRSSRPTIRAARSSSRAATSLVDFCTSSSIATRRTSITRSSAGSAEQARELIRRRAGPEAARDDQAARGSTEDVISYVGPLGSAANHQAGSR